jgi:hypothetical protein
MLCISEMLDKTRSDIDYYLCIGAKVTIQVWQDVNRLDVYSESKLSKLVVYL